MASDQDGPIIPDEERSQPDAVMLQAIERVAAAVERLEAKMDERSESAKTETTARTRELPTTVQRLVREETNRPEPPKVDPRHDINAPHFPQDQQNRDTPRVDPRPEINAPHFPQEQERRDTPEMRIREINEHEMRRLLNIRQEPEPRGIDQSPPQPERQRFTGDQRGGDRQDQTAREIAQLVRYMRQDLKRDIAQAIIEAANG